MQCPKEGIQTVITDQGFHPRWPVQFGKVCRLKHYTWRKLDKWSRHLTKHFIHIIMEKTDSNSKLISIKYINELIILVQLRKFQTVPLLLDSGSMTKTIWNFSGTD